MDERDVTLHMIGNAHLDPVWLWQWPEGKATFRSALDRLNEFPAFIFTSSSAAIYEWVEENDPGILEELRQRVAEGRWQIDVPYEEGVTPVVVFNPHAWPVTAGVIEDQSDTWSHRVLRFDEIVGDFAVTSVRLVESGPVRAVLHVKSDYEASTLVQDFILYGGLGSIEVRVTVDWREQFKMLKLLFPLNLTETETTYEIPYGVIRRPENGEEEPGQAWIDVTGSAEESGARCGLSILNDGKYSFHSEGGTVGLTVLRSPIYAHHDPYVPQPDCEYRFMDQGIQRFTYTLVPHGGDWRMGEAVRRAAELNQATIAMFDACHAGTLSQAGSFLAVDRPNVVVSVVKPAEDGDDLIVRAYETAGEATRVRLDLSAWGRTVDADFLPHEIKTLRVPNDASAPTVETDLIEWS